MATNDGVLRQLVALADELGGAVVPVDQQRQLTDVCELVRVATGAGSVSIARLDGDDLVYDAADGTGAAGIIGVRMPMSRGVAGYVARTGQSLIVDQVQHDPRFARDVAERTGYLPSTLLVVPVVGADDEVLGVVSVLDRAGAGGDPLVVASTAARAVAPILAGAAVVRGLGAVLVRALADAVGDDDGSFAEALRRQAAGATNVDGDDADDGEGDGLPALAAQLAAVRELPPAAQRSVAHILAEAIELATPRRRR